MEEQLPRNKPIRRSSITGGLSPNKSNHKSTSGDTNKNPIKTDAELNILVHQKLSKVEKYKTFQRWKGKFLTRFEVFLYDTGMTPANTAASDIQKLFLKLLKQTHIVLEYVEKGELSAEKKTVKASLSLKEMCHTLESARIGLQGLIPSLQAEEKDLGYTKFHLGTVLIQTDFPQYTCMKQIEDHISDISTKLAEALDRQQLDLFGQYKKQVHRFTDIMADLDMYDIMMKCIQFRQPPEESESEDPDEIELYIQNLNSNQTITIEMLETDPISLLQDVIATGFIELPIRQQVLKYNKLTVSHEPTKTLTEWGIKDKDTLTVEKYMMPLAVKMYDESKPAITLLVDPTTYVSELHRQCETKLEIPATNQVLYLDHGPLPVVKRIEECGIKPNAELILEPKKINVIAHLLSDNDGQASFDLQLNFANDTVAIIKEKIEHVSLMPTKKQVLLFDDGRELPIMSTDGIAENVVRDLELRDGDTIQVDKYRIVIDVICWDGKELEVLIEPCKTLLDLKHQVKDESGISPDNQVLTTKDGTVLESNEKSMEDLGITAGSVLYLEPKSIQVQVSMPDSNSFDISISPKGDSSVIKQKIQEVTGMDISRQVLKDSNGCQLPDGQSAKDMGIKGGSAVTVDMYKIPIKVNNTMAGDTIDLMVEPCEQLFDIKSQLEPKSNILAANQVISLNGSELQDDKTVDEQGIVAGTVLDLEPRFLTCPVKMPDETSIEIQISPNDDTAAIKQKITDATGMEVFRQVLKHNNLELPDGQSAKDIGLNDGSHLEVAIYKIPIKVNNAMEGNAIGLMVEPSETVLSIKNQLEPESDITANNQVVTLDGNTLQDDSTAAEQGIVAGTMLDLEPRFIKCPVNMPDGTNIEISISPKEDAIAIRQKIEEKTGVEVLRQVLCHNGKNLTIDLGAKEMGLKEGSLIEVAIYKIPIKVNNTMEDVIIDLMVEPCEGMSDIKKKLEIETGIPVNNQVVTLDGTELEDAKNIAENGIVAETVLDLEPRSIRCPVCMPDGTNTAINISPNDECTAIKLKIEQATGIIVSRQVVTHNNAELSSDIPAKKMGLKEGSLIEVAIYKIPIKVSNTMMSNIIAMMVEPCEKISDIKKNIEPETHIPVKNQVLTLYGTELEDNKTIGEHDIVSNTVLDVEPRTIHCKVSLASGNVGDLTLKLVDSIDEVRAKIQEITGIPPSRQHVRHKNADLSSSKTTVRDIGIVEGDVLDVDVVKIPISVRIWNGPLIERSIDPYERIRQLKKVLEQQSGIHVSNQTLSFNGNEIVNDKKAIHECNIVNGSILELEPKVIICTANMLSDMNNKIDIPLPLSTNTIGIKEVIEACSGLSVSKQVVKFKQKSLPSDEHTKVRDFLREGDILNVSIMTIPISVRTWDGRHISINVEPLQSLLDTRRQIELICGEPAGNQSISFRGKEILDDNKSLNDYGAVEGSTLDLDQKRVTVNLLTPDGTHHVAHLKPTDDKDQIKQSIAEVTGIIAKRQVVKHNGVELPQKGTVRDMKIKTGTNLVVDIFKVPIKVNVPDGRQLKLMIDLTLDLSELKGQLQTQTGIPRKKHKLTYETTEDELLGDSNSLSSFRLKSGVVLNLEVKEDILVIVDVKCGTLFGIERDDAIASGAVTPCEGNPIEFKEAAKQSYQKEDMVKSMLNSPNLGVKPQIVVEKIEIENYELNDAEAVKSKWGVSLKKTTKSKRGNDVIFVDLKTESFGYLDRQKLLDKKIITPIGSGKTESLKEAEKDPQRYDMFVRDIRRIFLVSTAK